MKRTLLATPLHPPPRSRSALLLLAPLLFALQACCSEEPREALATAPDRECTTGVESGFDIAVWDCVDQQHVVAHRKSSAFFGCSGVSVERAPCGELTPFERENPDATGKLCGER